MLLPKKGTAAMGLVELGAQLRRARLLYGLSLATFSERVGVSAPLLSRIERGRERASERVLSAYARHFRMQIDELNQLAGRVSSDVREYLLKNPSAQADLRARMGEEGR